MNLNRIIPNFAAWLQGFYHRYNALIENIDDIVDITL